MAKLGLVLVLTAVLTARVHSEEQQIDSTPRLFLGSVSTTTTKVVPTVTKTVFQPRTCIVIPAGVTSTCLRSSTAAPRSLRKLVFDANVHARHLRLLNEPSRVENVEPTASPVVEDRFLSLPEPQVESSQQDIGEYQVQGLPDSCGGDRLFGSNNLLTIVTTQSTVAASTTTVTTLFPASNTANRVSITIGNCIPSPALAYDRC